jgi:cytochrome b
VRIAVWDAPVRFFHWSLAVLVVFSFVSGKVGGGLMAWHIRSGEAILALLVFRLAWGFVGSDTARFRQFLRGPGAAWRYARQTLQGHHRPGVGHNPLGGWMVVALLSILAVQAVSGLFVDDEISTQGPLYAKASSAWVERMGAVHGFNQYVVLGAVVLHVVAIAVYWKVLRTNLVGAMVHGRMEVDAAYPPPRIRSSLLALLLLIGSAAAVYALVVVYAAAP